MSDTIVSTQTQYAQGTNAFLKHLDDGEGLMVRTSQGAAGEAQLALDQLDDPKLDGYASFRAYEAIQGAYDDLATDDSYPDDSTADEPIAISFATYRELHAYFVAAVVARVIVP